MAVWDLNYKHSNFLQLLKVVFNILYITFCLDHFSMQTQLFFVFLQSEAGSNNKEDKAKSCKHQSHNEVYSLVKLTNI